MRGLRAFGIWYAAGLLFIGNAFIPPWEGWLFSFLPTGALGVALIAWAAWCQFRWQRSGEPEARTLLERALAEHALDRWELWITADGKSRLSADHGGRFPISGWRVARVDTDQAAAVFELGRAAVTGEVFSLARPFPRVPRIVGGAMLTAAGKPDSVTFPEYGFGWVLRAIGLLGPGSPHPGFADAAEMRELAEQVRTAVHVPADEDA